VDGSKIATNSIAASKFANNCVTPSKLGQGASILVSGFNAGVTGWAMTGSWQAVVKHYAFIPVGAKYILLAMMANTKDAGSNVRLNVGGYTGSAHTCYASATDAGDIIYCGPSVGGAYDVSAVAGTWQVVSVDAYQGGGYSTLYIHSYQAVWWAA
jgi:hypothetical protein